MTRLAAAKYRMRRRLQELSALSTTLGAYTYDLGRYLRLSSTIKSSDSHRLSHAAKLTERYHAVEKALSLPAPRPAFGKTVIPRLIDLLESYVQAYGESEVTQAATGVLEAYRTFNLNSGVSEQDIPGQPKLGGLLARSNPVKPDTFGAVRMLQDEVLTAVHAVDLEFFTSRHSTRIFSDTPVTQAECEFATRAAMSAPAVCNREFGSITIWTQPGRINEILEAQGGARGFGHQVPALAMVTMTPRAYWGAAERNQGWIDGGMFAMSFLLGLHAQGLGAVALNWSKEPDRDQEMRKLTKLSDHRSIIMFVGFGHLQPTYRVAASTRRPISDFLSINPS